LKYVFRKISALSLVILLWVSCSPKQQTDSGFVKVDGTQFTIDGEPYTYVGTNFWYGAYLGRPGQEGNRERLKEELDILVENGITNLRVLGASEETDLENSLSPAFIKKDGSIDQDLLIGLDYLLSEMGKRKMKAVVFLNNYWEWSGGMSTWNEWYGMGPKIDPAKTGDWVGFMRYSAKFYTNEEANKVFRNYIESLIIRENSITGVQYKDDPTIMSWQLANEPRPGQGEESMKDVPAFVQWIDETAGFIKELAPDQLVSSGNEGAMGSLGSMEVFIDAHDTPNIDYLTFHMWAKNWGWYDAQNPEQTFPQAMENAKEYIREHVEVAQQLNKPIVMEEFGLGRDGEVSERGTPVSYRDQYFETVFNQVERYSELAGTNFWSWGGLGVAQNEDFWWKEGDPFVGDPPQEPQGLNSVFADDSTTLSIIKAHADRIK
jgi:mannan endo-1,4-beta-mannosidase